MSIKPYSTIVVGTDGSSLAGPTVARAAWLATREDADLVIVCPFTPMPRRAEAKSVATLGGDPKFDQVPGRQAATLALQEARQVAEAEGARVAATELVDAEATPALLTMIRERGADLIVLGAVQDRSLADRLLGTVAQDVVLRAQCDILVVRPAAGSPEPSRAEDVVGR